METFEEILEKLKNSSKPEIEQFAAIDNMFCPKTERAQNSVMSKFREVCAAAGLPATCSPQSIMVFAKAISKCRSLSNSKATHFANLKGAFKRANEDDEEGLRTFTKIERAWRKVKLDTIPVRALDIEDLAYFDQQLHKKSDEWLEQNMVRSRSGNIDLKEFLAYILNQ